MVIEPVDFASDELLRHEAALGEDVGHGRLLTGFGGEWRRLVATNPRSAYPELWSMTLALYPF